MNKEKEITKMAEIIRNSCGDKYWNRYIGKVYPIVKKIKVWDKDKIFLDMRPDENKLKIWNKSEIKILKEIK